MPETNTRYEETVLAYIKETGCSRATAEILAEQEIGANPDAFYPEMGYSDYVPRPLCD